MAGRYDVVVVGAGSGGGVVAGRLAAPGRRVLLLEAGPDHRAADTPPSISGPSFHRALQEPGRTWADLVVRRNPQQPPREYLRGRGVGGCSAVNAMVAMRAPGADHDEWGSVYGADGWSAEEAAYWYPRVGVPLTASHPAERGPLSRALLEAGLGAEAALLTRDPSGRRVSVLDASIEPARAAGLEVRGGVVVDRVLLKARTAVGVRLADGTEIEAGQVVVAAGAIHSPAVLLRSGVERDGIGRGLQDHPSFPIGVELHEPWSAGRDTLALSSLLKGTCRDADDLQVLVVDVADPSRPSISLVMAAVMRVDSVGEVRLASSDPHTHPEVDIGMLSDERDMVRLRAAVALAEQFLAMPAVAEVGAVQPYDSSDDALRRGVGDYVHATSTCRMGSAGDPLAVVDGSGRVHGYDGLWVCDASVLPRVPRANTHLPVMMVAERTAARLSALLPAS